MEPAASLRYLLAHPGSLGLTLQLPVALLLLAGAWLFVRWPHRVGAPAHWLRVAGWCALVLALAGLALSTRLPADQLTIVAAIDTSASIDARGRAWAREYVDALRRQLAPGDRLAVLAFSDTVELLQPPTDRGPLRETPPGGAAVTDLAAAIDAGAALLPAEGPRRMVLLTDGNETRGDSARRVHWLRAAGIRVDAVVPPRDPASGTDLRIERIAAPALATTNEPIPVRVVAHNTGPQRTAVLNLHLDGQIADSIAVDLPPGRSLFRMTPTLTHTGSHRLRAELAVEDAQPTNNVRETAITLRDRTRALVLTTRPHSPIAAALARQGLRAEVRRPGELRAAEALRRAHVVVLEDVDAASVPAALLTELERWVRDDGGGLVVAGGGTLFGDPRFNHTALQRLLPVTLEPHRPKPGAREPLALFLVIDRSNSMGYNSRVGTLRDGEKLRYAKAAALAVVRQLKEHDLVGVLVFDSKPHEVAPLRPLRENRRTLEELIPKLVENGGTDFLEALSIARDQLAAARVRQRHIILLTDGDTNRSAPGEYRALTRALAASNIHVTTIRIGDNTVNLALLRNISRGTGGEFHYVANARALPDLMLRETARALTPDATTREHFLPRVAGANQLLDGLPDDEFPALRDYAFARLRPEADLLLQVPREQRRDPLLAVWQYGLGRVAAFTASPTSDAEAWVGWTAYAKFWSQLARWVGRASADDDVAVEAHRRGNATELVVRAFSPAADGATFSARLALRDDLVRTVSLAPTEPRRFAATLFDVPPGRYPLTLEQRDADGAVRQQTHTVSVPAIDDDVAAEFERVAPNRALLARLTAETGGQIDAPPQALVDREVGTRTATLPLDWLLLPLAIGCFLADTALRLLRRQAP